MRFAGRLRVGLGLLSLAGGLCAAASAERGPLTVAERTGFRETARYADVVGIAQELDARFEQVRLDTLGRSAEGRAIPLLWVGTPLPDLTRDEEDERLRVLLLGTIHGGEVCGKEALLALVRDVAGDEGLLRHLALAVVPLLDPDGAERIARENRPQQRGPEAGVGQRADAQGLDLNRDFVKLEAPETRALARLMRRWDPHAIVDTHTTNGSYHRYTITYAGPKHPAGDPEIARFVRESLLPEAGERLERRTGYRAFFYGNFDEARTRWEDYPALPRYGTPYRGLRNRVAVLSEAYAYAPFQDRVRATEVFARVLLELLVEKREEVRALVARADEKTVEAGRSPRADDAVATRTRLVAFEKPVRILGWHEVEQEGRRVPTDRPRVYEVAHYGRFEAAQAVLRPYAYAYDPVWSAVTENLQRHGIAVEELREDLELPVEVYNLGIVERAPEPYQGHRTVRLEAETVRQTRRLRAGTYVVRTAQPLGTLAVLLLEPGSEDGLATWNFFDTALEPGGEFPVVRLPDPAPLLSRALVPLPEDRPRGRPVSLQALEEESFEGPPMALPRWMPDGRHYVLHRDEAWWQVEALTGRAAPLYDADAVRRVLAEQAGLEEEAAARWARSEALQFDRAFGWAHFVDDGRLVVVRLRHPQARVLVSDPPRAELAEVDPSGRWIAFVRDHDLWVAELETGTPRRLTQGGHDRLRRGKATWVYFEEVFGRHWKAYWWSPDGRRIAFLEFDDAAVPRFTLVDDVPEAQRTEEAAFPKPGQNNPGVRLGTVEVESARIAWADLDDYPAQERLLTAVRWRDDGAGLCFAVQDRVQTWLDLLCWGADARKPRRLLRETTPAWVSNDLDLHLLRGGSVLLASERDGWRHLYLFDAAGRLRRRPTEGPWEVRGVEHVDEEGGWVYFRATRDGPLEEHLYRVRLDGSALERLTWEAGTHRVALAPRGALFLDSWSNLSTPPRLALRSVADGTRRWLDTNPVRALEVYRTSPYERVAIPLEDGGWLEGMVLRPPDFDPRQRYPVWFQTYGGPHAPRVAEQWFRGFPWDQLLAAHGIVVFHADPRSASGKGARSAWRAYRRLGVAELEDIRAAVGWLRRFPWVDSERIGMSGASYGGFMTAYAMTHSELFAAGIAIAPVTDWRDYDSIYTERYMDTPQANPEGYARSSVVGAAANLRGRLLLVHGTLDDNVHAQHTWRLVRALQEAGKSFALMLYPQARHRIDSPHLRRAMLEFILRELGGRPHPEP